MFLALVVMVIAIAANAQVTTTSIDGLVTSTDKQPVIGAYISATHTPSGTVYSATTNAKGRFSIDGMMIGGPYSVKVTYIGFKKQDVSVSTLKLGETKTLNFILSEDEQLLSEVVVTGKNLENTNGASGNFNAKAIGLTPTVDRNIYDILKQSPLVSSSKTGGISVTGTNNRYNSFMIDGAVSNDAFGLTNSGTNGGQSNATPISLEAIEQMSINASPFDIRQSGFTGGAINVVTKSGTNEFHGSAYGYFNNQDFYGKWNQVSEKDDKLTSQSTQTYGFSVGGPIIKDKLFFFANAEYKYNKEPAAWYAGIADNYISEAQAAEVLNIYNQRTGFSDSYSHRDITAKCLSLLARIDWNIDVKNRLSFRYQRNDSKKDVFGIKNSAFIFNNSGYQMSNKTNSFVAELQSHISEQVYNEARFTATYVRDNRDVDYQGPLAYIANMPVADGSKSVTLTLGTDYSSGANRLNQDVYTIEDNLSMYLGKHTLTFGTHNEIFKTYNVFIQYSNGCYSYNNFEDYEAGKANAFYYNYSDEALTGSSKWGATMKAGQFGFYAQDKWNLDDLSSITFGIRFDAPVFFNSPTTNDEFNASEYAKAYNVKVGQAPSSKLLFSPRFGYRGYLNESKKSLLRGGTGIFTGRIPFVWISNCYSNTGMEMKGTTITDATVLNDMKIQNWQKDLEDVRAGQISGGKASKPTVNTVAKDFKYPQSWRTDLALEQELPYGIKMTLEALYSKQLNNIFVENLALTDNGKKVYAVEGVEASAAPLYDMNTGSYYAIVNLRNTDKGYSYSLSAKFEKEFDFGLGLMAAYTFGHSKSVNDGTSSVAYSNWKYNYSVDTNRPELSYSMFDKPHQILATVTYNSPLYANRKLNTEVGLTYNGCNGQRYSLYYKENTKDANNKTSYNGDGYAGNSLLYIPTDEELAKMNFKTEEDRTKFGAWIAGDSYAKNHRGQYAERYSNLAPWENHFDLHVGENFYYNRKGGKVSLYLDIINLSNMLNKNWGSYYSSTYAVAPLTVQSATISGDTKVATFSYNDDSVAKDQLLSRWHMQIGLKVTF